MNELPSKPLAAVQFGMAVPVGNRLLSVFQILSVTKTSFEELEVFYSRLGQGRSTGVRHTEGGWRRSHQSKKWVPKVWIFGPGRLFKSTFANSPKRSSRSETEGSHLAHFMRIKSDEMR